MGSEMCIRDRFETGHSLCSKQNIPCVRSRTFLVFEAGHSLCSKQDIPCVRSRTFLVFEARHSSCSKQDIPCIRSKEFLVFEAGHSLWSKQNIPCVRSTNFKRLKNREDSSDFDDFFWTESIATTRTFISNIFAPPKFSRRRKISR